MIKNERLKKITVLTKQETKTILGGEALPDNNTVNNSIDKGDVKPPR